MMKTIGNRDEAMAKLRGARSSCMGNCTNPALDGRRRCSSCADDVVAVGRR